MKLAKKKYERKKIRVVIETDFDRICENCGLSRAQHREWGGKDEVCPEGTTEFSLRAVKPTVFLDTSDGHSGAVDIKASRTYVDHATELGWGSADEEEAARSLQTAYAILLRCDFDLSWIDDHYKAFAGWLQEIDGAAAWVMESGRDFQTWCEDPEDDGVEFSWR